MNIRGDQLAYDYYNIACAYARNGNQKMALEYVRKSLKADEKFKKDIRKDSDLKPLWRDREFIALTSE